jgi:hypothetical protein
MMGLGFPSKGSGEISPEGQRKGKEGQRCDPN